MSEPFELPDAPYPGIRPFGASEHSIFFGRDEQLDALLEKLQARRFVAVLGESGGGKSSLVRAGLIPSLRGSVFYEAGSDWKEAIFRPGDAPIANLSAALAAALKAPEAELAPLLTDTLGITEALRRFPLPEGANLMIVADQFEELFSLLDRQPDLATLSEADRFVSMLLTAAGQSELPVYVVLTMRSEFMGRCTAFAGLVERLNEGVYVPPPLTEQDLREAIEGPASLYDIDLEPDLTERLLADMHQIRTAPDRLPLLQHALRWMWDRATKPVEKLTLADYETLDSNRREPIDMPSGLAHAVVLGRALDSHVEEIYSGLDPTEQRLTETLFRSLTERRPEADVRRPASLGTLATLAAPFLHLDKKKIKFLVHLNDIYGRFSAGLFYPLVMLLKMKAFEKISLKIEDEARDYLKKIIDEFQNETKGRHFIYSASEERVDITHEVIIRQWSRLRHWIQEEAQDRSLYRRTVEDSDSNRWLNWGTLDAISRWHFNRFPSEAWARLYPSVLQKNNTKNIKKEWIQSQKLIKDSVSRITRNNFLVLASVIGVGLFAFSLGTGCTIADAKAKLAEKELKQGNLRNALDFSRESVMSMPRWALFLTPKESRNLLSKCIEISEYVSNIPKSENGVSAQRWSKDGQWYAYGRGEIENVISINGSKVEFEDEKGKILSERNLMYFDPISNRVVGIIRTDDKKNKVLMWKLNDGMYNENIFKCKAEFIISFSERYISSLRVNGPNGPYVSSFNEPKIKATRSYGFFPGGKLLHIRIRSENMRFQYDRILNIDSKEYCYDEKLSKSNLYQLGIKNVVKFGRKIAVIDKNKLDIWDVLLGNKIEINLPGTKSSNVYKMISDDVYIIVYSAKDIFVFNDKGEKIYEGANNIVDIDSVSSIEKIIPEKKLILGKMQNGYFLSEFSSGKRIKLIKSLDYGDGANPTVQVISIKKTNELGLIVMGAGYSVSSLAENYGRMQSSGISVLSGFAILKINPEIVYMKYSNIINVSHFNEDGTVLLAKNDRKLKFLNINDLSGRSLLDGNQCYWMNAYDKKHIIVSDVDLLSRNAFNRSMFIKILDSDSGDIVASELTDMLEKYQEYPWVTDGITQWSMNPAHSAMAIVSGNGHYLWRFKKKADVSPSLWGLSENLKRAEELLRTMPDPDASSYDGSGGTGSGF